MAFNPLNWLLGLFSLDIAIDLGTANTLVYVRGKGIIINEPSWVTMDKKTRQPLAIGLQAKEMIGRTSGNLIVVRPLRDGVISEFEITESMLEYFIGKVHEHSVVPLPRPRVVIGIPSGVTEVEKRAVYDATISAGAREALLIEEPTAAALGAGLPIGETRGSMIVDIGGGTTDVAVISLDGVVYSKAVRVGGDKMDDAIMAFIKRRYNLMIGDMTAELIKIQLGSVFKTEGSEQKTMEIKGRDLISGIPKTLTINEAEIREALTEPVNVILDTIKVILENTPPELASDIVDRGIILAGGGALLKGLDLLIRQETGLPVFVADDPLSAVVRGVGKMLDELDLLRRVAITL